MDRLFVLSFLHNCFSEMVLTLTSVLASIHSIQVGQASGEKRDDADKLGDREAVTELMPTSLPQYVAREQRGGL